MKFPPKHLYTAFILILSAFLIYSFAGKNRLQTDLAALLPQEQQPNVLLQKADEMNDRQMNSQVVMLVGSTDAEKAFQTSIEIAKLWKESGVFAGVDSQVNPDLVQIRADVAKLGLASLPPEDRKLLFEEPETYFRKRAEAVVNPFAAPSPLPLEEDWLGFGRFVMAQAQPESRLQWNADNGMLFTEGEGGKTWVWLRGRLPDENNIANGSDKLLPLLQQSRAWAAKHKVETLSAGGAVFAAASKADAERESRLMGTFGLLLTFALLLGVFRNFRVFWLVLPLSAGMLVGLAATLAVFGEVHILTIVIGTSLVGMLVDFPLHWLTPSVFGSAGRNASLKWQSESAMRHVLPTFLISLAITVLGYALLWFTPLPVLRQTAVFSGFALFGAFGATVLWLPPLFEGYRAKKVFFADLAERMFYWSGRAKIRLHKRGWWVLGGFLLAVGLWRSDWQDDIRQWVSVPQDMLAEAQQVAELSGIDAGGKYLLVEASSQDELLRRNAVLNRQLQPLIRQQKISGVQSLDQWLRPTSEQQKLQNRLRELAKLPDSWKSMQEAGVPRKTMREALQNEADRPPVTLEEGLKTPLAEAWRQLYLGEIAPKRFASIVRLNNISDAAAVQEAVKGMNGVHWADKRAHLNELFRVTRNQAIWLKLASYVLAWFLIWRLFGTKRGLAILAVPLAAAVGTVAVLGWFGVPVNLFAMFGLLLVSAIGVDYAVYVVSAKHSAPAKLGGMLLAAMTTGISFFLLGTSSTPAVAAFGISVAVGVVLNVLLAGSLLKE